MNNVNWPLLLVFFLLAIAIVVAVAVRIANAIGVKDLFYWMARSRPNHPAAPSPPTAVVPAATALVETRRTRRRTTVGTLVWRIAKTAFVVVIAVLIYANWQSLKAIVTRTAGSPQANTATTSAQSATTSFDWAKVEEYIPGVKYDLEAGQSSTFMDTTVPPPTTDHPYRMNQLYYFHLGPVNETFEQHMFDRKPMRGEKLEPIQSVVVAPGTNATYKSAPYVLVVPRGKIRLVQGWVLRPEYSDKKALALVGK